MFNSLKKTFCQMFTLETPVYLPILVVERHTGRIINLEYVGEGDIQNTVLLVGKVGTREKLVLISRLAIFQGFPCSIASWLNSFVLPL